MYLFTAKAQRTQRFNNFLLSGGRPENKKNQLYKVDLIARATIFVTYVKLKLVSKKVLFYSLPSFLSNGIFGGLTAKNKTKHLCVLHACPVALVDATGVCPPALLNLVDLFIWGSSGRWYWGLCGENNLISWMADLTNRTGRNFEPNWQLFGEISLFNQDFGSLMPSLSLTLNVEP